MGKFFAVLALSVCLANANALHAQEMTKPLGKWERKLGKTHVILNLEDNRLHIYCTGEKTVTLHADYAITRDGLIYGVVTSIECEEDEEAEMTRTLFDAPFSFRFRIDEGALIIHDMKAHDADSKDDMWNGRYKAVQSTTTRAVSVAPSVPLMPPTRLMNNRPRSIRPLPPIPIAPSFSSARDGETKSPKALMKESDTMFNFWIGFIR
ncbi:MAG TPA: hypothetical protein VH592_11610 [Gemmataceae bacterium]|jgi:hypothetical protein